MTTATTGAATWPTEDKLRVATRRLAKASNAIDELHLTAYRFNANEDASSPTLAEVGMMAAFIQWAEMDLEAIGNHLQELREAQHKAACVMGD